MMIDQTYSNKPKFVTQSGPESVLTWETDAKRFCNYFSDAYREFTGLKTEELSGDSWTQIVHPDDFDQLLEISTEAFDQRRPFAIEIRCRRHDGVYRWFLSVGAPKFCEGGEFTGYSGTNFDISESKQIELTRSEEQQRLRAILEHSSTMIALLDTDLRFIYTNGPYASFWGQTPESLIGCDAMKAINTQEPDTVQQRFDEAARQGSISFEHKTVRRGKQQTLLVKYVRNLDAKEQVCGFYVFADDITALRDKERHFELILNNLPARVAYFDRQMELQYGNRAFFEYLDREPEELEGKPMVKVIGERRFAAAQPHIQTAIDGKNAFYEETEFDEHSLVYLVPNLDASQQTIGVFSLVLDVSQLKRAEAQLRRSDRQFELALRGSQVGFWETEVGCHEEFFTENIESLLGLPIGKLRNSREAFYCRVHPDDIDSVRQADERQLIEPGSHVNEFRLLMSDDQYKWFRSVGETEQDKDGNYVRSAGTIANINNLKNAELEAAAQVRNRDIFLSMLSHELRNPLSAIWFAAEYCRESGTLPAEHKPMFDIISRQTEQTSRMLADLLDVNRVASNRLRFEKKPFDLTELLESTASATRHVFGAKRQSFTVDIQPELATFGDGVRLQQAFTNLLDNASKYSPEHASISFSAALTSAHSMPEDIPRVAGDIHDDDLLVIRIEDNGQGIPKKDQENIFDLFFQTERSIDRSSGGLGLGLFLVNEIIVAHGGSVTVQSSGEGQGSSFVICLHPTSWRELNQLQRVSTDLSPCKVALVEDNRDARLALTHTLMSRGCEITSYRDGMEAAEHLPAEAPDFAIIDIGLPKKNGLELMKELQFEPSLKQTVFVALTGYGQSSDHRDITEAGFNAHLVKPIDVRQLLQLISEHR